MKRLIAFFLSVAFLVSPLPAAREFNGTTAYIAAASIPLPIGTASRTVSLWVRTTTPAVRQFIYSEGDESGTYSRFAIEVGNTADRFSINIRSAAYDASTVVVADTWYHVALVFDGSFLAIYVDGANVGGAANPGVDTQGSGFNLGRFYAGVLPLSGQMAEVAKWSIDLSATEVLSLSKGISPKHIRPALRTFYAPLVRDVINLQGLAITDNGPTTAAVHPRIYR